MLYLLFYVLGIEDVLRILVFVLGRARGVQYSGVISCQIKAKNKEKKDGISFMG